MAYLLARTNVFTYLVFVLFLKKSLILGQNTPTVSVKDLKKSLGYYQDTYLNFTELTTKYGFPTEEHKVITKDGYILSIFRILSKCKMSQKYPVLLFHGLFDSSDTWILAGPKNGLGYLLANNCYDVWAANTRGNNYSRKHLKLDPDKDIDFWNFSFDEHANFDLPAIIDYILIATDKTKVNYLGHSQGTTVFFAMASQKFKYNDKIQLSINFAPVVWMGNVKTPAARALSPRSRELKDIFDSLGFKEVLAKHRPAHGVSEFLCQFAPVPICGVALYAATGYVKGISPKTMAVAFGHVPSGTSTKSFVHYGQMIVSHKFRRYDEGLEGNFKRYNSPTPPEYNVSSITTPVVLLCGKNDWLSSLDDVDILNSTLPNVIDYYVIPDPIWSHNNHLWGIDAPVLEFPKVLEHLKRFNS